jgi:quercetin dioxygenase-like cupin family protein
MGEQRGQRGEEERVEEDDGARQEQQPAHGDRVYGPEAAIPERGGPEWGTATDDLNATVLAWPAGGGAAEHVNDERDVVLVVLHGSAELELDGVRRTIVAGDVAVLEKGRRRRVTAGKDGVRYVTVHRKRSGLAIATLTRPR